MVNQNNPIGNSGINPFPTTNLDNANPVKLNEDRYEVYINGQFVGHKTLKTQGEKLSDIDSFLRVQGFKDFSSSLDGDHYTIQTIESESALTNSLSIYFNNR